jgi:hypothetical protein
MAKSKILDEDQQKYIDEAIAMIPAESKAQVLQIAEEAAAAQKKSRLIVAIVCPIVLALTILLFCLNKFAIQVLVGGIIFDGLLLFGILNAGKINATRKFKEQIVPVVIKAVFGSNAIFNVTQGWSKSSIADLNIIRMGNVFNSDTYIKGAYKNVNFAVANTTSAEQHTDSKGNTSTVYFFKGLIAVYEFNKQIPGTVEIREDEGNAGTSLVFKKDDVINFEDIAFNKGFNVYADDRESAFYVITPQFIETFNEIKRRVPGTLIFRVQSDRLIIAIDGARNSFDYPVSVKNANDLLAKVVLEVLPFKWFIDMFNLTDSFGKKALEQAQAEQAAVESTRAAEASSQTVGDKLEQNLESRAETAQSRIEAAADNAEQNIESSAANAEQNSDNAADSVEAKAETLADEATGSADKASDASSVSK